MQHTIDKVKRCTVIRCVAGPDAPFRQQATKGRPPHRFAIVVGTETAR